MDGVCVVYRAGFVGFLVAGVDGCDCRFYDPHRVPRLAWTGLPVVGGTKGTGRRVSMVQSPQMLSFPHGRRIFQSDGEKRMAGKVQSLNGVYKI